MELITQKLKKSDVKTDPFPYLIVKDAIDDALCDQLLAEYPPLVTTTGRVNFESNKRYSLPAVKALKDQSISPLWHSFIKENISQKYLDQIIKVFKEQILKAYPDFEQRFGPIDSLRAGVRHQDTFDNADILIDTQICINTPVLRPSSVRGGHLDNPDKLIFGIFYMRHPDDDSKGGELEVYRHKDKNYRYDYSKDIDHKYLELLETVPYEKNVLFLCLNTPDAVHGVSPRSSTDIPRYIVNLVLEVKEPLFNMPKTSRIEAFLRRYGFLYQFNARAATKSPYELGFYTPNKKSVLVLNPEHVAQGYPKMQKKFNIIQSGDISSLSKEQLEDIVAVIVGKGEEDIEEALLEKMPNVSIAGYATGSFKKYKPQIFINKGIPVINVGRVYAKAVAEIALMHMIAGIRSAALSHNTMRSGGWGVIPKTYWDLVKDLVLKIARASGRLVGKQVLSERIAMVLLHSADSALERVFGLSWERRLVSVVGSANSKKTDRNASTHTLYGSTVGIIGFGPVAHEVIELLRPFNCRIKLYSEYLSESEAKKMGVELVTLDEACKSDVVSIHRGFSHRTKNSFGEREINLIPVGSVLVNTSRGKIVDEGALLRRLRKGEITACLDVYANEPLPVRHPLRTLPNVMTTAHIAASTDDTYREAIVTMVDEVIAYTEGKSIDTKLIKSNQQIENMT